MNKGILYLLIGLLFFSCDLLDEEDDETSPSSNSNTTVTSQHKLRVYINSVSTQYEDSVKSCFNGQTYTVKVEVSGPKNYLSNKSVSVNNSTTDLEGSFDEVFTGFKETGTHVITTYINEKLLDTDDTFITESEFNSASTSTETIAFSTSGNPNPCGP